MKTCERCGAEMPNDFIVCGKCGNSLGNKLQTEKYGQTYDIFLSYRRDGGEAMAILIRDRLVAKGYNVFLDIENLNSGSFNRKLLDVIDNCKDFVVICSKGSLDRCVNDDDWVRLEIVRAFEKSKNIVPIMLRGFDFPDVLPDDINELRNQNGVNANSNEYFDAAVDRLAEKFLLSKPIISVQTTPQQPILQQPVQEPVSVQQPTPVPTEKNISKTSFSLLGIIGVFISLFPIIIYFDFNNEVFFTTKFIWSILLMIVPTIIGVFALVSHKKWPSSSRKLYFFAAFISVVCAMLTTAHFFIAQVMGIFLWVAIFFIIAGIIPYRKKN